MILKSLYLKNYRTYRGPETIYFAEGEKNITIIKGNNEVGKTTIMNAITWCLYGIEPYKNEGNEPIWSKSTTFDMQKGDDDITRVILIMEDSKGKEVKFIRELEFYKNDNGDCKKDSLKSKILVDEAPVQWPETYLKNHLPKDVRQYFLFDGEQLESYFSDENNQNIKKSVYQLSQLNLLENALKHLKTCKKDYENDLEELNPKLAYLLKKDDELSEKKEQYEKERVEIESNIKIWKNTINENNERIKRFGNDPEKLIDLKEKLQEEINKLDKDMDKYEEERDKFLVENLPKIYSIRALLCVNELGKDLEEKGFIPARFKKEFLKDLLDDEKCICGTDLSEGTPSHNKLKELYEKTSSTTDIADKVNLLLGNINSIINNYPKGFDKKLKEKLKRINTTKNKREKKDKEIYEINLLLDDIDEDLIKELHKENSKLEKFIDNNNRRLGSLNKQIELIKEELDKIKKEIIDEEGKIEVKLEIEKSLDLCKTAMDEINLIYKILEKDIHQKLQELTSVEFGNMHWKQFYEGVEIDRQYNVQIRKQGGYIVPDDLSKGGKLVLALSFMTALNSLSGFGLPIVIDTPLGRLDEPIKENIGKQLPYYTQNKQVTLLVTGSEYSDAFRKGIREYVGKEYELNYIQEKEGITTIENIK